MMMNIIFPTPVNSGSFKITLDRRMVVLWPVELCPIFQKNSASMGHRNEKTSTVFLTIQYAPTSPR